MEPYRGTPLEQLNLEVATGRRLGYIRYELDATELREQLVGKPSTLKRITLSNVQRVQLTAFNGETTCVVRSHDGTTVALATGLPGQEDDVVRRRSVTLMIEAINERIATASPNAQFICGTWGNAIGVAMMTLILAGLSALLPTDSIRGSIAMTVLRVLIAASAFILFPLALLRGRPQPYDPRKIPPSYDPFPKS